MSKKPKTILVIIISLIIIGIITFMFFYKNKDGISGFRVLFPFGQNLYDDERRIGDRDNDSEPIAIIQPTSTSKPRLFQIHETPIAGATIFTTETEDGNEKTIVRYLERGLGHIYETDISTMEERRISNITRLKIHEALWGNDGKNVVIRYLDRDSSETIRSFVIKLSDTINDEVIPSEELLIQKEVETEGLFLPKNISNVAMSPNKKEMFYLIDKGDSTVGIIYNIISGKSSQVFSSEFTEWLPQWPNKDLITLTTKPSGKVPGILYSLDVDTEEVTRELGGVNGLTTLTSPDGTKVLYSKETRNGFSLNLYDMTNRERRRLPFTTLPEKCIWDKNDESIIYCGVPTSIPHGTYPDEWYQGVLTFSDELWSMNIDSGRTTLIANPMSEARENIDIVNLSINDGGGLVFFTNKKDLSLWGARLFIF